MIMWSEAGLATLLFLYTTPPFSAWLLRIHIGRCKEVVEAGLVETPLAPLSFSWFLGVGVMVERASAEVSFSICAHKAVSGLEPFTSHLLSGN